MSYAQVGTHCGQPDVPKYNILYNLQHCFRWKLSTETQLIRYTKYMLKGRKDGNHSNVNVMDITKVFDKVSHTRVKSTNLVSWDIILWNVPVYRVHLFCYGLLHTYYVPILFTHRCIIHKWKDHGVSILFVSICIAKLQSEYTHIAMDTKQPSTDLSHFKLHFQ